MRLFWIRHQNNLRKIPRMFIISSILLVLTVFPYLVADSYRNPSERVRIAEAAAAKAQEDLKEAHLILAGQLVMIEPINGLAKICHEECELVENISVAQHK